MGDTIVGFIGFGLIGGSIAKAIKQKYKDYTCIAYNYYVTKEHKSLELARQEGTLDRIVTELSDGFSDCDIIFLCAPVLENMEYLTKIHSIIKPSCIITDVGSVKSSMHEIASKLGIESNFIGGHPMAGSEKTGYQSASPYLLENAYYVLTPTSTVESSKLNNLTSLIKDLGAIPVILDANYHDDVVAAISHVPHIIAATLVNLVHENDSEDEMMRLLAAGGFKDLTRIASSSPVMWQNICLTNSKSITKFLKLYITYLLDMIVRVETKKEEDIFATFQKAKDYRDSIPRQSKGLLHKVYEVFVDIIDETGAIATIATILASNGISIKNIGIIHNREFEEGVLRIELYEEEATQKTVDLLKQYHYTIYQR